MLDPVNVRRLEGEVSGIDLTEQTVAMATTSGQKTLSYDRLVFALGSQLLRPNVPGLAEHSFDVDTYSGAVRLNTHLESLPGLPESLGQFTIVVVGAGLTGIEAAAEMPGKLRAVLAQAKTTCPFRVILTDHQRWVGSDMGDVLRVTAPTDRDTSHCSISRVVKSSVERSGKDLSKRPSLGFKS